ncbi:unnamed protein product [Clonostachys rosea f. rosea IK726]|uniref:Uncharacterized protein n=1 Tax=Clonostachys rosea f. rosea IK726 TaxID=1349383 RepID=A0ACA9TGS9_BIOOC|nr:unnamed protein product [Clonostachys rosea f. rosea IK726]
MSLRNIPDEVLDHILSLVYWRSSTPDFLKLRLHTTQWELAHVASQPPVQWQLDRGRKTHWRQGFEWMLATKARVHFLDAQGPFAFLRDAVEYLLRAEWRRSLLWTKSLLQPAGPSLRFMNPPGLSNTSSLGSLARASRRPYRIWKLTPSREAFYGISHLLLACGSDVATKIDFVINGSATLNTARSISSHPLFGHPLRTFIDLEEVVGLQALMKHFDLDAIVDGKGSNALVYAAETDRKNAVRLLLDFSTGAQINARGSFGLTTLGWAARREWTDIVQVLLQRDDINADIGNHEGETPLAEAAKKDYHDIAQLLMAKTSVIVGSEKSCPLRVAFDHCAIRVLRLFLDRFGDEIDINQEIADGHTPLTLATQQGFAKLVKMLLEVPGVKPDQPDSQYQLTPLAWAVKRGSLEIARDLVNLDIDITRGANNQLPAVMALHELNLSIVDLLIHKTLDTYDPRCTELMFWPNSFQNRLLAVQRLGQSAQFRKDYAHEFERVLDDATGRMIASLSQEVLQHKEVDISCTSKHSAYDLLEAAGNRSSEKIKLLLTQKDVDINARSLNGKTALMEIVSSGDISTMMALLNYSGIDLNLDSPGGGWLVLIHLMSEPLGDSLLSTKRRFLSEIDWDYKAGHKAPLLIAAEKDLFDAFELLYDDPRTNLYITDYFGRTCLWYAVQNSNKRMVEKILDRTPRIWDIINAQDEDGLAPLHVAANIGNVKIAKMLIRHPAIDINAVAKFGWTALHIALTPRFKSLPQLLLEHPEIDLSLQLANGWTAFDFLKRYRCDLLSWFNQASS